MVVCSRWSTDWILYALDEKATHMGGSPVSSESTATLAVPGGRPRPFARAAICGSIVGARLDAVGKIALLVAGLGIANTMVTSILERTRGVGGSVVGSTA